MGNGLKWAFLPLKVVPNAKNLSFLAVPLKMGAFLAECKITEKRSWEPGGFSFQKGLVLMKKKGYRGSRCEKRHLSKCADGVAKTYTDIESRFADLLQKDDAIKEFRCNVLLDGFSEGEYCSDFVCIKADGDMAVRECVYRKILAKPMTVRLLDASREYWLKHGVSDWGIVVEQEG